ncbi:MAG: DUF6198 family protein [Mailhella sp.]|nr:DUF6198 family protein [Mailhella sp.]
MNRERIKRWLLFFISLFFLGNGIAIVTNAQLGTTPISSLPFVVSMILDTTMGKCTFALNALLLLLEIPLFGKAFRAKQFLQLPCVFVFSLFIDLGMWLTQSVIPEAWFMKLAMSLIGTFIMAFGITLEIASNTTVLPGEGFVLALAYRTKLNFGNLKVINDVTLVALAIIVGLLVLGSIEGLREGTILSAFLNGVFIRHLSRHLRPGIERWLKS